MTLALLSCAPPVPQRGAPGSHDAFHAMDGMRGLGAFRAPTGNFYSPEPAGRPFWYPVFPQAATPALIPGQNGGIYLNPAKDAEQWFWLSGQGPGATFPVTIPAGGTVTIGFVPPSEDSVQGDYEIVQFQGTWTPLSARFTVDFNAVGLDRKLTPSGPVENNHVFGTASLPGVLFETVHVQAATGLTATLTNLSATVAITASLVAVGRRFMEYDEAIQARRRERFAARRTIPAWLVPDQGTAVTVPASGAINLTFSVPSHADFECYNPYDDSDSAYTVQLFMGLSSRAQADVPMDAWSQIFAPFIPIGGFPNGGIRPCQLASAWVYSHVYKRNSKIQARITGAVVGSLLIPSLHGRLLFYGLPEGCAPTGSRASIEPTTAIVDRIGAGTVRGLGFMSPQALAAERWRS